MVVSECPNNSSSTPQSHSLCYLLIEIFFNQSQRRGIHHEWKQRLPFKTLVTCLLASYYISLDAAVAPVLLELWGMFILEKAHIESFSWWTTLSTCVFGRSSIKYCSAKRLTTRLSPIVALCANKNEVSWLPYQIRLKDASSSMTYDLKAQAFKVKSLLPSPISKFFI